MAKPKTHFPQVPLEMVKKIVEEQVRPDTVTQQNQGAKKKKNR
jgi:hypothetical protein